MAEAAAKIGGVIHNAGNGQSQCDATASGAVMAKIRAVRKRARTTIFSELKASTFHSRKYVLQYMRAARLSYARLMTTATPTGRHLNEWNAGVEAHSGELSRLLTATFFDRFSLTHFFAD